MSKNLLRTIRLLSLKSEVPYVYPNHRRPKFYWNPSFQTPRIAYMYKDQLTTKHWDKAEWLWCLKWHSIVFQCRMQWPDTTTNRLRVVDWSMDILKNEFIFNWLIAHIILMYKWNIQYITNHEIYYNNSDKFLKIETKIAHESNVSIFSIGSLGTISMVKMSERQEKCKRKHFIPTKNLMAIQL